MSSTTLAPVSQVRPARKLTLTDTLDELQAALDNFGRDGLENKMLRLTTKIVVYNACVLPTLLYRSKA